MSSQGDQAPGGTGSSKRSGTQSLRPVTIASLYLADQAHPEAEFVLHGKELSMITFIGVVRTIARHTTSVQYGLEDGTGKIDCRHYMENADDHEEGDGTIPSQGTFIRVMGTLKTFNTKRHVAAQSIRQISMDDCNEIPYHFIECIRVKLWLLHGPPSAQGGSTSSTTANVATIKAPANQQKKTSMDAAKALYSHMSPDCSKVMEYIQLLSEQGKFPKHGIHIEELRKNVKGLKAKKEDEMSQLIEDLKEEGLVYTTSDEYHIAPSST